MDAKQTLKWAVVYLAISTVAAAVGVALIGAGASMNGALVAYVMFVNGAPTDRILSVTGAGVGLQVVGVLVWQLGWGAAIIGALVTAIERELGDRFDPENVKSQILSVLDERLAEMHGEISQTRHLLNRVETDEGTSEFEFQQDH